MALSTSSNFSVILSILFAKIAKTPAIAVATLGVAEFGDSGTPDVSYFSFGVVSINCYEQNITG